MRRAHHFHATPMGGSSGYIAKDLSPLPSRKGFGDGGEALSPNGGGGGEGPESRRRGRWSRNRFANRRQAGAQSSGQVARVQSISHDRRKNGARRRIANRSAISRRYYQCAGANFPAFRKTDDLANASRSLPDAAIDGRDINLPNREKEIPVGDFRESGADLSSLLIAEEMQRASERVGPWGRRNPYDGGTGWIYRMRRWRIRNAPTPRRTTRGRAVAWR